MTTARIWMDGDILPLSSTQASPLAHGLHYGTGVFEGIRSYETAQGARVFRLTEHLDRMKKGADILGMPFAVDHFYKGTIDTLKANNHQNAYIRPIAYYESGGLSLDVAPLRARGFIATLAWTSHLGADAAVKGVSLRTSSWRRNPATSLPPLKLCGNYVNSIIAKREAALAGAMEALFVDDKGFVCECTGENVFVVKNGRVTAVAHPDALPGITRATVMALTGCAERPVTAAELADADEIFLTGTSAEIAAVSSLDGRDMLPGPVTRELARLYQAVVHGEAEQQRGWLHGG
jgi:branched-chain amino acid aminotransferase